MIMSVNTANLLNLAVMFIPPLQKEHINQESILFTKNEITIFLASCLIASFLLIKFLNYIDKKF